MGGREGRKEAGVGLGWKDVDVGSFEETFWDAIAGYNVFYGIFL